VQQHYRSRGPHGELPRILVFGWSKKNIFLHRPERQKNRRAKEMSASGPQQRKEKRKKEQKKEKKEKK
jgi:hypothetical protein